MEWYVNVWYTVLPLIFIPLPISCLISMLMINLESIGIWENIWRIRQHVCQTQCMNCWGSNAHVPLWTIRWKWFLNVESPQTVPSLNGWLFEAVQSCSTFNLLLSQRIVFSLRPVISWREYFMSFSDCVSAWPYMFINRVYWTRGLLRWKLAMNVWTYSITVVADEIQINAGMKTQFISTFLLFCFTV